MKTAQIQIEQVPIGELRPDPAVKRIEQLNQTGMGVAGHILYRSQPRNQACRRVLQFAGFREINSNRFMEVKYNGKKRTNT